MSDLKTALVIPDMHIPYQDKTAFELMLKIANSIQIDQIVQVGDFIDAYPISKYVKNPQKSTGFDLQNEFDEAELVIQRLVKLAPLKILKGNHEERLEKYLKEKAPGLYGLKDLKIKKLLKCAEYNIDYLDSTYLGNLFVFHGDLWTKSGSPHAGQTAMRNVDRSGLNVMHGHIHRLGSYYVTKKGYELKGFEIGCMCQTDVEYCHSPNWQIGFSLVHYRDCGDKAFYVELIEIEKCGKNNQGRKAFFRGKVYEI